MRTIDFPLTKTFNYANNSGAQIECSHIELREPTGKVSSTVCAIEGLIQHAILSMADMLDDATVEAAKEAAAVQNDQDQSTDSIEEKDGDAMMATLVASGVDMEKLVLHFRELFKQVAWMGGEKLITTPRMDEMSHRDFRMMMGVYAANFIVN